MSKKESMMTINRAVQVLKAFSAEDKEFSLTELNTKLGISKSSLQRILYTLTEEGFLEKDERSKVYKLGIELYFLGNLVEANSRLLTFAKKHMQTLNNQTFETITLNINSQNMRKCIGYIPAKHELTTLSFISKESPLYAGASAKTLLAYLPDDKINKIIDQANLEKLTQYTVTDKIELYKQLKDIREKGFAISEGERLLGVYAISAPVKNRFDEVIASITITIPSIRIEEEKSQQYIEWILNCTNSISKELGHVD